MINIRKRENEKKQELLIEMSEKKVFKRFENAEWKTVEIVLKMVSKKIYCKKLSIIQKIGDGDCTTVENGSRYEKNTSMTRMTKINLHKKIIKNNK